VILKAAKMIAPELEDRGENFLEKVREETENMSVDFKSARENILRWMIENKIPKHLISVFDQNVVYGDDDLSNLGKRLGGV